MFQWDLIYSIASTLYSRHRQIKQEGQGQGSGLSVCMLSNVDCIFQFEGHVAFCQNLKRYALCPLTVLF